MEARRERERRRAVGWREGGSGRRSGKLAYKVPGRNAALTLSYVLATKNLGDAGLMSKGRNVRRLRRGRKRSRWEAGAVHVRKGIGGELGAKTE